MTVVKESPPPFPLFGVEANLSLGVSWKILRKPTSLELTDEITVERVVNTWLAAGIYDRPRIADLRRNRIITYAELAEPLTRVVTLTPLSRGIRRELGFAADFDAISATFGSVRSKARGKATFWPTMTLIGSGVVALGIALGEYKDGREGADLLLHDLRRIAVSTVSVAAEILDMKLESIDCQLTPEAKAAIDSGAHHGEPKIGKGNRSKKRGTSLPGAAR